MASKNPKLTKARLQKRLRVALMELHAEWGAVPVFCDKCDAITDADAEVCPNGHPLLA